MSGGCARPNLPPAMACQEGLLGGIISLRKKNYTHTIHSAMEIRLSVVMCIEPVMKIPSLMW